MDVIETVQKCIETWNESGSEQCLSFVTPSHSNPSDPDANDILTTAYQTLLNSTFKTWSPRASLSTDTFVEFVRSVLDRLPSSSAKHHSANAALFGEILVDLIWTIDAELEDVLADARVAVANAEQGKSQSVAQAQDGQPAPEHAARLAKIIKAKENAESDKDTLADIVRKLLAARIVDPDICRERLDTALIANVHLIADKLAFEKKEIRMRTALFYKQNKFNLLREQSEGYSKLTTEVNSNLGPAHAAATGLSTEPDHVITARALYTWNRVLALIGYFDLDPNRALDVILDVFSVHLATHWRFFLAFLSASPWSSRSRQPPDVPMAEDGKQQQYEGKNLDEILEMAEVQSGYVAPDSPFSPPGSNARVLAQVLGFKFSYYQSLDVKEDTPRSLYLLAALLIREGYITVEDLYLHISPTDEGMDELYKKYLASIDTRISNAKISQLAMAAPLSDSLPSSSSLKARPSPAVESKKAAPPKEIPNQKLGLLHALLSLGALRPAFSLLSKFRWLVDARPEIADLILRIVKHSIQPLSEAKFPAKEGLASFKQPRARYSASGVVSAPERRKQLTLCAPTPPSTNTVDFVFFFPHWADRIPMSSTMKDIENVIEPFLKFIGLHISRDLSFLIKFVRLGRMEVLSTLETDPQIKKPKSFAKLEHPIQVVWFRMLRHYILPALPLVRGNAVCAVDIWNMLRLFDTTQRWRLYGEWRDSTYQSHPELRVRRVQAERESKGILRRLSSNTLDSLSGTVAKLAHSDPIIFFANAVHQIMAYDNLGSVVIQALKFITIMGFDVLLFLVVDALANPNKERIKPDGVNISDWYQSLASFTGMIFRRYGADLNPVLTYIVHQLHNNQTMDLIVLKELIWKMAGIEPLPSLTDAQVVAMAGGPVLRIEAVASETRGARFSPADAVFKGPQRLGKALMDSSLATPLLIQIAQQRQACVHQFANMPVKALANFFDLTHGVLLQYLELLNDPEVIKADECKQKVIPSLAELNQLYGIPPPICMQIIRPILHDKLLEAAKKAQDQERIASEEAEKRLKATLTAKREPSNTNSRIASPTAGETTVPVEATTIQTKGGDGVPMDVTEVPSNNLSPGEESPWLPELSAMFDDVKRILPSKAVDIIGPAFYLTFWQMSTYDISPPTERYHEESVQLRELSRKEDLAYVMADRSSDRAKRATASIHRDRRNRINQVVQKLSDEAKDQTASRMFTIKRLAREKNHWFPRGRVDPKIAPTLASAVVEHCLHPRCLLSPMDADYCVQMIKLIHMQGTPGFSTLMCYDKIFGDHMRVVIFSSSEYEAHNYGRFLHGILTDVTRWYKDEQLFLQDNRTKINGKPAYLPGFQMKFAPKSAAALGELIRWTDFRSLVKKWHRKLDRNIIECIESGKSLHIYNALLVLKELFGVFPRSDIVEGLGSKLKEVVNKVTKTETRSDIKVLSNSYGASLQQREHEWNPPESAKLEARSKLKPKPDTPAVHDVSRTNGVPAPPSKPPPPVDSRRITTAPVSAPSAPRAQLAATAVSTASLSDRPAALSTRAALESIPRPEVVRRVRPEARTPEGVRLTGEAQSSAVSRPEAMNVDVAVAARNGAGAAPFRPASPSMGALPPLPKDIAILREASRPTTPSPLSGGRPSVPIPQAPRINGEVRLEAQTMPPPPIPSQSAQELREAARQSRPSVEKDDKASRPSGQIAPSPVPSRRRSLSPLSRPGTRSHSAESRASGGRARDSTRSGEGEDKRDSRVDLRDVGRRDHRERGRGGRESDRDKETDRTRDRRDRHGDRDRRDRDRERDRDKDRERDRDIRDRERDRERDRDRDRDRDRHRRDDKERDHKDRELGSRTAITSAPAIVDDRGLPSRPEPSRHRGEDSLGKRRRPTDDDQSERASKRPSRKEEDRSRRPSDKDGHDRLSDKRRKDRESQEGEGKSLSIDTKASEKRIPDAPASARALPPSTPSAPRAMASSDSSRAAKPEVPAPREREWRQRDQPPRSPALGAGPAVAPSSSDPGGSLRSRISDKESRPLPQAPSRDRIEGGDRGKPDSSKDDDRDSARKRTLSERDRDLPEPSSGLPDPYATVPKRPKINRNRYVASSSSGLAKKLLPIDADKARSARKD